MPWTPLNRTGWVATASDATWGAAALSIDGNSGTWWNTTNTFPQWLVLDMLAPQTVDAVTVLPRQDGFHDNPGSIEIYMSTDGTTWGSPVYTQSGLPDNNTLKTFTFPGGAVTKRYLKYQTLSEAAGSRLFTSVAEINAGSTPSPVVLSCAGLAVMSSAYIVIGLSRTDVPTGDLPPIFHSVLSGVSTADIDIANWDTNAFGEPAPTHGAWNPATTYAVGNTVSRGTVQNAAGTVLANMVWRSLQSGNTGHDPVTLDGWWTCMTQTPHNDVNNTNWIPVQFGYALNPLPTASTLAAATWNAVFYHSLFWTVTPPGDVVQLLDLYVKMNYLVGGTVVPVASRPQTAVIGNPLADDGNIFHPGINAQFQVWHTAGLAEFPDLTLSNFQPPPVDGMEAVGTAGSAYLSSIVASGGTPPYVYAIIAGSLPEGVTLNGTTGVISGTPTASGIFTFTAKVTDAAGATAQVTCAIPIGCGGGGVANAFY